ncbi:MAG: 30S ribosome-binding factor RbfA [Syntrophorhabdaceae bacterium]|nr:30S ribosome-binding factor RbfA [Syntrophorhabdaceae bacterium]
MKGRSDRQARVAEKIREELSVLLHRKVNDPRLASVTITDVGITPDLKISHVNYTTLADESERKEVVAALRRAEGFLRRELGAVLGLRSAPALRFHYDDSYERGVRIDAILKKVHEDEEALK